MPRAATKADLLKAAAEQYEKMWALINTMNENEQHAPFAFALTESMKEAHWSRDKNLRDVLVHLYEWHQLLIAFIEHGKAGRAKSFLPEPYNWKTYGEMNMAFWNKHQATPYDTAKQMLAVSHAHVMALIAGFTNEELFEAGVLKFTGTSTLGAYCVSATASHYDWAMKKIKAHLKTLPRP